jgi:hypothetical protein
MAIRVAFPLLILLAAATAPLTGQDTNKPPTGSSRHAGLEPFKQLAGQWAGKEVKGPNEGKEVRASYKVTAAGSAVVETLFPGEDHEMITVIHPDGDDLVLTHYCALGNQPQMKAPGKEPSNKIAFKFVRATNLRSEKDPHMHDVAFTFVDKDTLRAEWTYFREGKPSGTVVFAMKRQK